MKLRLIGIICALLTATSASALSLSLDSIATWGKFPRFAVNTYRWGCDFFNGYDTTFVTGTGYPFNIKTKADSWVDYYNMKFENGTTMDMISDPSTSLGFYLTYLAVSAGYDMNMSKYLYGSNRVRKRFNFQFSCMLFSADLYFLSNDVGTHIRSFRVPGGERIKPDLFFTGINNKEWGLNLSYFFKHKRYSAAAAFSFSRVQIKSGGSFYAGLCTNRQQYYFDFNSLPEDMKAGLPEGLPDYSYSLDTRNYFLKVGYGYNWVFAPRFILGVTEAPMIGLNNSVIKNPNHWKTNFVAQSITQISVVYNNDRWFAGAVGTAQIGLARNNERTLMSGYMTFDVSVGWRFSLW